VDPVTLLPVFNEEEEINAIIDLIEVANEVVKKPVFLLLGNDLGRLANKVIDVLGLTGQSNAIAGFAIISMINTPGFSDKISDFTQSGVETFQRCFPQNPGKFCTLINNTQHDCFSLS
jgi:hypothetical protein